MVIYANGALKIKIVFATFWTTLGLGAWVPLLCERLNLWSTVKLTCREKSGLELGPDYVGAGVYLC